MISTHSNVSSNGFKIRGMEAFDGGTMIFNTNKKFFDFDTLRSSFSIISPLQYKRALFDIYFPDSDDVEISSRELLRFNKSKMFLKNNNVDINTLKAGKSGDRSFIDFVEGKNDSQESVQEYSISFDNVRSGSLFSPYIQISDVNNKTIYVSSSDVKLESSNFVYKGNVIFKDKLAILSNSNEDGFDTLPQGITTQLNIYTNYNDVGGITIEQGFQGKTMKSLDILFPLNIGGEDAIEISYTTTVEEEEEVQISTNDEEMNSHILLTSNKKRVIASTLSTNYINSDFTDVAELRYGPFSITGNMLSSFTNNSGSDDNSERSYLLLEIDTDVEQDLEVSEININGAKMNSTGLFGLQTKFLFSEGSILKVDNVLDAGDIQISLNESLKLYSVRNMATENDGKASINMDYKNVVLGTIDVNSILVNNILKLGENSLESLEADGELSSIIQIGSKLIAGKVFAAEKKIFLESIISGNISIETNKNSFGSIIMKHIDEKDGTIGMVSSQLITFDRQIEFKREINGVTGLKNINMKEIKGLSNERISDGVPTFNVNGISFGVSLDGSAFLKQFSDTDKITVEANEIRFQTPNLVFNDLILFTTSEIKACSQNGDFDNNYMETALLFNNYSNILFSGINNYAVSYIASNYKFSLTDVAQDENICIIMKGDEDCILTSIKQSLVGVEITEGSNDSLGVLRFFNPLNVDKLNLSEASFLQTGSQVMISSISNNLSQDSISLIVSKNDVGGDIDTTISATSSTKELELSFPLIFSNSDINKSGDGVITVNRVEFNREGIRRADDPSTERNSFLISGLIDFRVPDTSESFILNLLEQKEYSFVSEGRFFGNSFSFRLLENLDEISNVNISYSTIESCVIFDFIHFCTIIDSQTGVKSTSIFQRNYYNVFDHSGNITDQDNMYGTLLIDGGKLLINENKDPNSNIDNSVIIKDINVLRSINFVNWYLKSNDNVDFDKWFDDTTTVKSLELVIKNNITISSEKPLQFSTEMMSLGDDSKLEIGSSKPTTIFFEKSVDPENLTYFHIENDKTSSSLLYIDTILNIETNRVIFGGDNNIEMEVAFEEISHDDQEVELSGKMFASIKSYFKDQDKENTNSFLGFSDGLSVLGQDSLVKIGDISFGYSSNESAEDSVFSIQSTYDSLSTNSKKIFLGKNIAIDVSEGTIYNFMEEKNKEDINSDNSIIFEKNLNVKFGSIDLSSGNEERSLYISNNSFQQLEIETKYSQLYFKDGIQNNNLIELLSIQSNENYCLSFREAEIFYSEICQDPEATHSMINFKEIDGIDKILINDIYFGEDTIYNEDPETSEIKFFKSITGVIKENGEKSVLFFNAETINISGSDEGQIILNGISTLEPVEAEQKEVFSSVFSFSFNGKVQNVKYSKYQIGSGSINSSTNQNSEIQLGLPGGVVDFSGVTIKFSDDKFNEIQIGNINKVGDLTFTLTEETYYTELNEKMVTNVSRIGFKGNMSLINNMVNSSIRSVSSGFLEFGGVIKFLVSDPEEAAQKQTETLIEGSILGSVLIGEVEYSTDDSKFVLKSGIAPTTSITNVKFQDEVESLKLYSGDSKTYLKLYRLDNITDEKSPNLVFQENGVTFSNKSLKIENLSNGDILLDSSSMQINNIGIDIIENNGLLIKSSDSENVENVTPLVLNKLTDREFIVISPAENETQLIRKLYISRAEEQTGESSVRFSYSVNSNETVKQFIKLNPEHLLLVRELFDLDGKLVTGSGVNTVSYILDPSVFENFDEDSTFVKIVNVMHDNNGNSEEPYSKYEDIIKTKYLKLSMIGNNGIFTFVNQRNPKDNTNENQTDDVMSTVGTNVVLKYNSINFSEGSFGADLQPSTDISSFHLGDIKSFINIGNLVFGRVTVNELEEENILFNVMDDILETGDNYSWISSFYGKTFGDIQENIVTLKNEIVLSKGRLIVDGFPQKKPGECSIFVLSDDFEQNSGNEIMFSIVSLVEEASSGNTEWSLITEESGFKTTKYSMIVTTTSVESSNADEISDILDMDLDGENNSLNLREEVGVQMNVVSPMIIEKDFVVDNSVFISLESNSITFNDENIGEVHIPSFFITQYNQSPDVGVIPAFSFTPEGISFSYLGPELQETPVYKSTLISEDIIITTQGSNNDFTIVYDGNNSIKIENKLLLCENPIGQSFDELVDCTAIYEDEIGYHLGLGEKNYSSDNDEIILVSGNTFFNSKLIIKTDGMVEISDTDNIIQITDSSISRVGDEGTTDEILFGLIVNLTNEQMVMKNEDSQETVRFFDTQDNGSFILNTLMTSLELDTDANTSINVGNAFKFTDEGISWSYDSTNSKEARLNEIKFMENENTYIIEVPYEQDEPYKLILDSHYVIDGDVDTGPWIVEVKMYENEEENSNLDIPVCVSLQTIDGSDRGSICVTDDNNDKKCEESNRCGLYHYIESSENQGSDDVSSFAINVTEFSAQTLRIHEDGQNSFAYMEFEAEEGLNITFSSVPDDHMDLKSLVFKITGDGDLSSTVSIMDFINFGRDNSLGYFIGNHRNLKIEPENLGGNDKLGALGVDTDIKIDISSYENYQSVGGENGDKYFNDKITTIVFPNATDGISTKYTKLESLNNSGIKVNKLNVYDNFAFSQSQNDINNFMKMYEENYNLHIDTNNKSLVLSGMFMEVGEVKNQIIIPFANTIIDNNLAMNINVLESYDCHETYCYQDLTRENESIKNTMIYHPNSKGVFAEEVEIRNLLLLGSTQNNEGNIQGIEIAGSNINSSNIQGSKIKDVRKLFVNKIINDEEESIMEMTEDVDGSTVQKLIIGKNFGGRINFTSGIGIEEDSKELFGTKLTAKGLETSSLNFQGNLTIESKIMKANAISSENKIIIQNHYQGMGSSELNLADNIETSNLYDEGEEPKEIRFELHSGEHEPNFLFKKDNVDSPLIMSFSTSCININGLVMCNSATEGKNGIDFSLEDGTTVSIDDFSKIKVANEAENGCFEINIGSKDVQTDESSEFFGADINIYNSISIGDIKITQDGISPGTSFINVNINLEDISDGSSINIEKMIFGNELSVNIEKDSVISWSIRNLNEDQNDGSVQLISPHIGSLITNKLSATDQISIYYENEYDDEGIMTDAFIIEGKSIDIEALKTSHDKLNVRGETLLTGSLAYPTVVEILNGGNSQKLLTIKEDGMVYEDNNTYGLKFSTENLYVPGGYEYNIDIIGYMDTSFFPTDINTGITLVTNQLSVKTLKSDDFTLKVEADNNSIYLSLNVDATQKQEKNIYANSLIYNYPEIENTNNNLHLADLFTNLNVSCINGYEINKFYTLEQLYFINPQVKKNESDSDSKEIWTFTDLGESEKYRYGNFEASPKNFTFTDIQIGFMSLITPLKSGNCDNDIISFRYDEGVTVKNNKFYISSIIRGFILVSAKTVENIHCTFLVEFLSGSSGGLNLSCLDVEYQYKFSSDEDGFTINITNNPFNEYELFGVMIDYDTEKVQQ